MTTRILLALGLLLYLAPAAPARVTREDAIQAVIGQQMDAFRRDDGAGAFALASPSIQALFRTPETFLRTVEKGYPQVYRPKSAQFLELVSDGGRLIQKVLVQGSDGTFVVALFEMVEIDGRWRINGCILAVAPRASV